MGKVSLLERLGLARKAPLSLEAFRQRVIGELVDHGGRDRCDVGAGERDLRHVVRGADRGGEDLRGEIVVVVDLPDLLDELDAVEVDVIETAEEGRDVGRAAFGREQRLVGREAERDVGLDAFVAQGLTSAEAIHGERDLHDDIVGELGEDVRLFHHRVVVD